jgi:hypothetical protein
MAAEEDEFMLYAQDTVFVFKVPPRTSAAGYKCVVLVALRGISSVVVNADVGCCCAGRLSGENRFGRDR